MNDEACIITVNNIDYYYPCDRHDDILLIGNSLVNVSSSSITLYHDFPTYGENTTGYPRITLPSNSRGYIRQTYNGNQANLIVNSASFKSSNFGFGSYLNLCIFGALILLFFRK